MKITILEVHSPCVTGNKMERAKYASNVLIRLANGDGMDLRVYGDVTKESVEKAFRQELKRLQEEKGNEHPLVGHTIKIKKIEF